MEPIKNPVTGEPEQIRIEHGTGFIFKAAECVSAKQNRATTQLINFDLARNKQASSPASNTPKPPPPPPPPPPP